MNPAAQPAPASLRPGSGGPAAPASAPPLGTVLDLIGHTPMITLGRFGADEPRAEVVAKLENRNPGGSVKDRTALGMVEAALASGRLAPRQGLVEPTAGNTGIGLALVAGALGHPVTVVMPERYSPDKRRLCHALGARVVVLPGEHVGMAECRERARRLADEGDLVLLDQFENPANPAIHERTTGPEMWEQLEGRVDAVVLGVGTGGTFTGVVRALRRHAPDLPAVAVESEASVIGGGCYGHSRIEGLGNSFVPGAMDCSLVTEYVRVKDADAFLTARELARSEGLLVGGSTGAVAWAALGVARRLGPGRRVATLIPDVGERYCSQGLYDES